MRKALKHKKDKVHKLTEEEYAEYVSSLKESVESPLQTPMSALNTKEEPFSKNNA